MKAVAFLLLVATISTNAVSDVPESVWTSEMASDSIKASIIYLTTHNHADDVSGLLIALGELKTQRADQALLDLSDYAFDGAVGEDSNSVITHRGKKLLPLLRAKLGKTPLCDPLARCLTIEQRNDRLRGWIKSIEKGEVIAFNQ
jgi:hypothetical protein